MKKTIIIIVIFLFLSFGFYFITSNNNSTVPKANNSQTYTPPILNNQNTDTNPVSTTPSNINTAPIPAEITVNIKNLSFAPPTLDIKVGTKVTWINSDNVPHTVTSDSGNLLNSRTLSPGQSFSFTFTNPGSTSYHCAIHTMMKGNVVVTN